jgi:hypothetical protein
MDSSTRNSTVMGRQLSIRPVLRNFEIDGGIRNTGFFRILDLQPRSVTLTTTKSTTHCRPHPKTRKKRMRTCKVIIVPEQSQIQNLIIFLMTQEVNKIKKPKLS